MGIDFLILQCIFAMSKVYYEKSITLQHRGKPDRTP